MNKKLIVWLAFLAALMLVAFISWVIQLRDGLIVAHIRNPFSWGLYISTFAFLVGVAAGGLIVSSSVYIFKIEALKPLASTAALTAFVCVSGAGMMVIPDLGRPDRMLNLLLHPNFTSPLVWDIIVINCYAGLSLLYTYNLLLPGLVKRKSIFSFMMNKRPLEEVEKFSHRNAKILAPIALPFAVLIHTITAWVFATQASRPWWFSAIIAPDFIAVAVASGSALVLLVCVIAYGFKEDLKPAYHILAKLSAIALIVHLFFMYNDFMIRGWWQKPGEFDAMRLLFTDTLVPHLIEVVLPLIASIIFFSNKLRSKPAVLLLGIILMLIGAYSHRFLLMPSAYNFIPLSLHIAGSPELWAYPISLGQVLPNQDVFVTHWAYVPSLIEISIAVGVLSVVAFMISVALAIFPFRTAAQEK